MPETLKKHYSYASIILLFFCIFFVVLFILSFPFGYHTLPDIGRYTGVFFEGLGSWVCRRLHWPSSPGGHISSDSKSMYVDLLVVAVPALMLAIPVAWLYKRKQTSVAKVYRYFVIFASYYLSLQLLKYGFNKVFKWQFYLPEPNTLFTTVGNTPRDLLYWSTMGLSHSYSVFSGLIEVIPALLLLFRRTRVPGAFILSGVLLNVVWINFSYDISVKIYSVFLLLLSLLIAAPAYRLLFRFFIRKVATVPGPEPVLPAWQKYKWLYVGMKSLVVAAILLESLWIYLRSGNYNDDTAARPLLHGAWQVQQFGRNGDTSLMRNHPWEKAFVHRRGYFIVQQQGAMQDYLLHESPAGDLLTLEHYETGVTWPLKYQQVGDSILNMDGVFYGDTINVRMKRIDMSTLEALQKEFNWTSD